MLILSGLVIQLLVSKEKPLNVHFFYSELIKALPAEVPECPLLDGILNYTKWGEKARKVGQCL